MAYARSVFRSLAFVLLLAVGGLVAACSDNVGVADTEALAASDDVSLTPDSDSDGDGDSESDGGESSGATVDPDPALPGTPLDNGPQAGEQLDVISIRHDDVLNFRTGPDPSASLVDTAVPQALSPVVVSSGEGRQVDSSIWWKVTVDGQEAWANFAYLGMLGRSDDVLDELRASSASTEGETVQDVVASIAASRAEGLTPRVTYLTPVVGVRASDRLLTVDVVTVVDSAQKGERFELRFEPVEDGFRLTGAERTLICGRGVTSEGQCQ